MNMNMNMILIIIIFSYHLLMITIPTAFSATPFDATGDKYIGNACTPNFTLNRNNSIIFTFNSNYSQSRDYLLEDLRVNTPAQNGFSATTRANDRNNRVYGMALCRGDLSRDDCQACLNNVTREVNISCTNTSEAIIYHDHCFMKYSAKDFYGMMDYGALVYLPNNSSTNSSNFNDTTMGLLSNLVKAATNQTETYSLFARGENKTDGGETVYGMVQCTKDISPKNCSDCLENATANLQTPPEISGRAYNLPQSYLPIGATVFNDKTCVFRYETYPFLKE